MMFECLYVYFFSGEEGWKVEGGGIVFFREWVFVKVGNR